MILEVPEITQEIGHSRAKRPRPAKGGDRAGQGLSGGHMGRKRKS
jgi:hypothetical protein